MIYKIAREVRRIIHTLYKQALVELDTRKQSLQRIGIPFELCHYGGASLQAS